jgi:hypothetical protein
MMFVKFVNSKLKFSIIVFGIFTLFTQCSKSDSTEPNANCTLTESFVVGKWQFEKVEVKQNGVYVDYTSQIEPCQKDDYFLFNSNGTYSRVDAGLKCTSPIVENGTWKIINGKVVYSNGTQEVVTIISCTKAIREFTSINSEQLRYTMIKIP